VTVVVDVVDCEVPVASLTTTGSAVEVGTGSVTYWVCWVQVSGVA
jgi:hypothetical protein